MSAELKLHTEQPMAASFENEATVKDDDKVGDVIGQIAAPAVEVCDVSFAYPSTGLILQNINLSLAAQALTMIVGVSGGGKTTLLKLIKNLLPLQHGAIRVHRQPLTRFSPVGKLDSQVAYIPQQLGLVRHHTALANALTGALGRVGLWRSLLNSFPLAVVEEARATLAQLGLATKIERPIYSLSGGERQRVAIARALMQRPRVILADEFVSQLDAVTTDDIMRIMRDLTYRGVTLIMTTHELSIVTGYADRAVVVRDGQAVFDSGDRRPDAAQLRDLIKQPHSPEQANGLRRRG